VRVRHVLLGAVVVPALLLATAGAPAVQAEAGSFHLTASGDFSATSNTAAALTEIAELAPDAHLALGDLSYGTTATEQEWCDFVTQRVGAGFPFELLAGNHESNGQDGNINDFSACLPNQLPGVVGTYGRQYYVDVPQGAPVARVLMISPGITYPTGFQGYASGSPQYAWTASAIDGARAAGIPWVVVGAHMPCQSLGEYSCPMGADLMNLLVQKRVDLVLNGHEHLYQRTKQLAHGTGCATVQVGAYDADCVVDADAALTKGAGTVMATVGTGGVPLRTVHVDDPEAGYFAAWSGIGASPSYGVLDLDLQPTTLTARFVAATGTYSDAFTITTATGNQPPQAVVAAPACSGLQCTFSSAGSNDPDGTIASYDWTFGDGGTATGASPTHTYAAGGTYEVGLTVTDDDGAQHSTSRQLVVSAGAAPFASDTFARTIASGWGSAELGGPWVTSGTTSVAGGVGRLTAGAGAGASAALRPGDTTSTDLLLTTTVDKAPTGSGSMLWVRARRVTGAGDYRSKTWWQTGGLRVSLVRATAAGTETLLTPTITVPGTFAPGDRVRVRTQVTGTAPTTLRLKVWREGQPEPTAWTATATDATAGLQVPGSITLSTYVSGSATNGPVTISVDDLVATP
jgi:PKD repeat protein